MKRSFFLLLLIITLSAARSPGSPPSGNTPPRVVIGILVENMRPDYIERYWDQFQEFGFKKLYSQGTRYTDFRIIQHIQGAASGTATLFTGVTPAVHGIINASWYDRKGDEEVHCVRDERYMTLGGVTPSEGTSPLRVLSSTLGDQLKLSSNGKARVFSIAMNDATAVIASGYSGDAAWWFDGKSGNMVTSSYYLSQLPDWVTRFNNKRIAHGYASKNWAMFKSLSAYSASVEDRHPQEQGYGPGLNLFPHNIGNMIKSTGDFSPLRTTPFANNLVREFASQLLEQESIGKDEVTDLVTIAFSSMDTENNSFGPASMEMEDLYLRLDQEIATLVEQAEKRFGKENLLIFLTSNVSASYPVDFLKESFRFPVATFSPENAMALLNSYLNITFGDLRWIAFSNGLQLYLNHKLLELNKVSLPEMRGKIAEFMAQFEGVDVAVTADQAEHGQIYNPSLEGIRNSYNQSRSGDVLFILREGWQPAYKFKKVNYTGENLVPLVFYGAGTEHRTLTSPAEAISLTPTLCRILGIPSPGKSKGSTLTGF